MSPQPSPLKSDTARVNGAQSNGPVTAEGQAHSGFSALCATKETAKSSLNALRHGLCSKQVVMPGEDQAAYDQLRQDYHKRFQPQGPAEIELADTLVNSSWRRKRIMNIESALFADENTDTCKAISLMIRYENQLNRTYEMAFKRLELLQRARVAEAQAARAAATGSAVRNEPKPAGPRPLPLTPKDIHDYIMGPIPGFKEPSGGPR